MTGTAKRKAEEDQSNDERSIPANSMKDDKAILRRMRPFVALFQTRLRSRFMSVSGGRAEVPKPSHDFR